MRDRKNKKSDERGGERNEGGQLRMRQKREIQRENESRGGRGGDVIVCFSNVLIRLFS